MQLLISFALLPRVRSSWWTHCGHAKRSCSTAGHSDEPRHPFGDYGILKAEIEELLLDSARRGVARAVVLHPGHMVGPGWNPLNPAGHFNPEVFTRIAHGELLQLPNEGMETVHHVHADDVAQAFELALTKFDNAIGESFHVVSPGPLSLRAYAEAMFAHFGRPARLGQRLGYAPRYTSLEAVIEAVKSLIAAGVVRVPD